MINAHPELPGFETTVRYTSAIQERPTRRVQLHGPHVQRTYHSNILL